MHASIERGPSRRLPVCVPSVPRTTRLPYELFAAPCFQGTASAPLWDPEERSISGVISASDFINILRRLRHSVSSGANPMSEVEMDAHTIRCVTARPAKRVKRGSGEAGRGR